MTAPMRFPVDDVASRHAAIHADLEAWGRWSHLRQGRVRCGSAESGYRPRNGNIDMGWEFNPPENKPVQLPNTRLQEIDRAILYLPAKHKQAIKMHYLERRIAERTCRVLAIPQSLYHQFLTRCRDMVENILLKQAKSA